MSDLIVIAYAAIGAYVVGFGATAGLIIWASKSPRTGLRPR